jgi:Zinc dependent phospholipase C
MAGTFTHFLVCDVAKRQRSIIGVELWKLLNKYSEFLFIGSVGPDLPYLSFKTGKVNWADVMHYERTNSIAISGYEKLAEAWASKTSLDETNLVWLLGFISHLIIDATIHPVVQAIVGPYEQNKEEHRICEMTEDALSFYNYKKTDLVYAEFSSILRLCGKSENFDNVMEFWKEQAINNYLDKKEEPHPSLWFDTYLEAIDVAEGGSDFVGIFRHLGIGSNYIYHPKDEIKNTYPDYYNKYFLNAKLPTGLTGDFTKVVFDYAVNNVADAWSKLFNGLTQGTFSTSSIIKNWNLDTGVDMDSPVHEITYWRQT